MLIQAHNSSCKGTIKIIEEEMSILKQVDQQGSDVEQYIHKLDTILKRKIDMMVDLRKKAHDLFKNLKTEENMAKLVESLQQNEDDEFKYEARDRAQSFV